MMVLGALVVLGYSSNVFCVSCTVIIVIQSTKLPANNSQNLILICFQHCLDGVSNSNMSARSTPVWSYSSLQCHVLYDKTYDNSK